MNSLSSELVIRTVTLSDAQQITSVHLNCWKINYQGIVAQDYLDNLIWEKRLKDREQIINSKSGIQLVAIYNNKLVGFCDAGKRYIKANHQYTDQQLRNRNEPGEIYAIYVDPHFQHQGIGKALFEQVQKELAYQALMPFVVLTLKENQASCRFYESMKCKLADEIIGKWGGREYPLNLYRYDA